MGLSISATSTLFFAQPSPYLYPLAITSSLNLPPPILEIGRVIPISSYDSQSNGRLSLLPHPSWVAWEFGRRNGLRSPTYRIGDSRIPRVHSRARPKIWERSAMESPARYRDSRSRALSIRAAITFSKRSWTTSYASCALSSSSRSIPCYQTIDHHKALSHDHAVKSLSKHQVPRTRWVSPKRKTEYLHVDNYCNKGKSVEARYATSVLSYGNHSNWKQVPSRQRQTVTLEPPPLPSPPQSMPASANAVTGSREGKGIEKEEKQTRSVFNYLTSITLASGSRGARSGVPEEVGAHGWGYCYKHWGYQNIECLYDGGLILPPPYLCDTWIRLWPALDIGIRFYHYIPTSSPVPCPQAQPQGPAHAQSGK